MVSHSMLNDFRPHLFRLQAVIPVILTCSIFSPTSWAEMGDHWTQATASAPWGPRTRFPVVVLNGKMWVIGGGYTGSGNNDVYSSSDGVNWTTVTTSAPWPAREWNKALVFDNKMWLIGGTTRSADLNDVWYSSDGINWNAATLSAPWAPRCCHSVVVFMNKMWVLGGVNEKGPNVFRNDVWSSSDGINWTQETASAGWNPRHEHTSVVFNDKIWVLGGLGAGSIFYNDVWSSSNGITWTQETGSAGWDPRYAHSSVVLNGRMWVMGGAYYKDDIWYSINGANWTKVVSSPPIWNGRSAHASVAFNNRLWVLGGFTPGGVANSDVWYSDSVVETTTIPIPNLPSGARPLRMVRIPSGTFQMGSPAGERGRDAEEGPVHSVTITRDFYISECEITQAQWKSVSGVLPTQLGAGDGNNYPVRYMSWNDCQAWITALNRRGLGKFRLPTEAEWEHACRAGTSTRFSFGDNLSCDDACGSCPLADDYMWWCGNSGDAPHPVGMKLPNHWGLFDMHGNVFEWCQDWYKEDFYSQPEATLPDPVSLDSSSGARQARGGVYTSAGGGASVARSAQRHNFDSPDAEVYYTGLRLVREAEALPGYVLVPTGLRAIGGPISILLTWDPNPDPNIAGYNVYRDTNPNGSFTNRLNTGLVTQPRFEDTTAVAGILYYYRITAQSETGNESAMSGSAQATRGTVEVWMPDVRGPADSDVTLRINVTFGTGITGNGMDVKVTYDPSLLTPVEVQKTVLTQSFTFVDNISVANGQINISGISASGATVVGEGHILDIVFHVAPSAATNDTGAFAFVDVTMFDATPTALSVDFSDTALFTVATTYILGDIDGSGAVNSGDALIAQKFATGERIPTTLELHAGDINGDGVIDSADVTLILRIAVGLPLNPSGGGKSASLGVQKGAGYQVSVGSDEGQNGETVTIPVDINTLVGVAGVKLVINFDPFVLQLQNVIPAALVQAGYLLEYDLKGSSLFISLASSQAPVSTGGTILNLVFNIVGYPSQASSLPVTYLKLSGQYGENLAWSNSVSGYPGLLGVGGASGFEGDTWLLYE